MDDFLDELERETGTVDASELPSPAPRSPHTIEGTRKLATEAGRHQLYEKIATEWGEEHAEELMSYLPPVGWADVATKQHLDTQTVLLRTEITAVAAELRGEMQKGFASQLRWMIGTMIAMTGIFSFIVSYVR